MNKINKTFASEIKQIGDESERILRFITSTEAEDRDGDIIEIDGWQLQNYMKNPVILYGHNYEGLPVGRSVNVQKDSFNKKLIQDVKFPTKEEYEFADTVYRLAKAGYLNATSVGFIGIQSEPRLDDKGNYLGKKYKKQELLETSIVPVPSNPTALMEARSKGIINDNEFKMFEEAKDVIQKPGWDETETSFRFRVRDPGLFQEGTFRTVPIKKDKPRVNSVMGRLKDEESLTVQSVIFPKEDDWDLTSAKEWLKEHEDLTKGVDKMKEKTVIPYKKYPLADEGANWDGSREIATAEADDLKMMCAWYDAENADNKGAYKLPHHKAEGYTTVWRAVAAAMAALLGARGGVDIPDADKKGAYNHLAKHYKDFDKEPPEFKSYTDVELKSMFDHEEKVGASISAKNMEMMQEAMEYMQEAMGIMEQIISAGNSEEERKPKSAEIKQALDEIKSQVLLLCKEPEKIEASKEIDLDAIEWPKTKKDAEQNELKIEPGALKELMSTVIKNQLTNGGISI
jgi:HK97 family phage prohead protease